MNIQLAGHTLAFYNELDKQAVTGSDGERLFVGSLTQAYYSLGISSSMYSRVKRILIETGSIEIVQRGTGAQPSIARLRGAPDPQVFSDRDLTSPRKLATLMSDVERRLEEIEAWRESMSLNIPEALREHEVRLNRLESADNTERNDTNGAHS